MSTGLYPGVGTPLYRANDTYPQEPVWSSMRVADPVIPTAKNSVGIALNAGATTSLNVLYGTVPTGTAFSIMYSITPDFVSEYALDTVAAVALQKAYTWSTADMVELDGFIRIANSGGQDITHAYGQQRGAFTY